jgi:shikimate kinase
MIEEREKRTINEIFTDSGEEYFRDVEAGVIGEISAREGVVIDAGGGAVLSEENMANFKSGGIVICLKADPDIILTRTKKYKHRPLLNVPDPKRKILDLLNKRAPFYAKADHLIDTGKMTVRQAVDEIVKIAGNEKIREGSNDA